MSFDAPDVQQIDSKVLLAPVEEVRDPSGGPIEVPQGLDMINEGAD